MANTDDSGVADDSQLTLAGGAGGSLETVNDGSTAPAQVDDGSNSGGVVHGTQTVTYKVYDSSGNVVSTKTESNGTVIYTGNGDSNSQQAPGADPGVTQAQVDAGGKPRSLADEAAADWAAFKAWLAKLGKDAEIGLGVAAGVLALVAAYKIYRVLE